MIDGPEALGLATHGRFKLQSHRKASLTSNFFSNGKNSDYVPEIFLKACCSGTDGTLSGPTMTSFFVDQRFPHNWHRRASPGALELIAGKTTQEAHPIPPGANNRTGQYVEKVRRLPSCES
jgi:hypothetical protein